MNQHNGIKENANALAKPKTVHIRINLVDIFKDTCDQDSVENLELERFKVKLREIWTQMLEQTYVKYPSEDMDMEQYMEHNALKFADEPETEDEIDNLMNMLDELMTPSEELEGVQSEGKAPKYGSTSLKSNNEQGKKEATSYEYKHAISKTPSDSRSGNKGGSYAGTPSGSISKKKDDKVIRSFSPMAESLREELKELIDRQRIGKRRQLFRS
jgi:hypothetical protein